MAVILFIMLVAGLAIGWAWYIYKEKAQAKPLSLLPKTGTMLSGAFVRRRESIHVYCQVEDSEESRLLVRVLSELGKSSLLGMRAGTPGQLEVGNTWLPIEVLNVSLPWVVVEAFTGRAKPAQRESLRIPASFTVRFRAHGLSRHWIRGEGINVSAGGFCFSSKFAAELKVGRLYEIELNPGDTGPPRGLAFVFIAELRWLLRTMEGTVAGLQLSVGPQQRDLARFTSYMEHRMARHPEDYLLETNPKPELVHRH
ncbi:MAG TPA: PilZ domain-containing protein [Candidatus Binatia bacterium]